jgi:hypothetical protein
MPIFAAENWMRSALAVGAIVIDRLAAASLIGVAAALVDNVIVANALGCWMRAALTDAAEDTDAAAEAILASPSA